MSAGDIDDRLGPEGILNELREANAELDAYLSRTDIKISRDFQVPFGAGMSEDGNTCYIDPRLNLEFRRESRQGPSATFDWPVSTHEMVEWALRKFVYIGENYTSDPRGHRIANRAEYEVVEQLLGPGEESWKSYDDFMDPQLQAIQKEELTSAPPDLAMYPYEGTEWEGKIREVQDG